MKGHRSSSFWDQWAAPIFLGPALLVLTLAVLGPLLYTVYYSFLDYNIMQPNNKFFVGLGNFHAVFQDELAIKALYNTFYFVVAVVPLQTGLGFLFALLVNKAWKEMAFYKVAFFSPTIMSLAVVSILWLTILNPNNGLANQLLQFFGIPPQPFLTSPSQAMSSIVALSAWQGCGSQMLIFLAGLKSIPSQQYEAATIDGAGKFQQFIFITLPNLRHTFYFILITITIQAFKLIIQPMIMTNGGPLDSTKTVLFYIFETGFRFRNIGYASAISVLFIILIVFISLIQQRLSRSLND
ncbi:MAG: carbohydrate ABC transporter permease [Brevinema sp.]